MLTMCPTYRTRAALPWPRPHCARCVPWRAADAAAPHGCTLLDLAFAWSVSPQSVVCPVLRGGVGWEGRRSVRDACACELEQERARTLHPYDHSNFSRAMLEGLFHEIPLPRASCAAGARILL